MAHVPSRHHVWAQDLHDRLAPLLASIRLRLEVAVDRLEPGSELRALVLDAAAGTGHVVDEIRRIIKDQPPTALAESGLSVAVGELVARLDGAGPRVRLHGDHMPAGSLPEETERAAYFIAAEALANAIRHSLADEVTVWLTRCSLELRVEVTDNGIGLRPSQRGRGLDSMIARAEAAGGLCGVGQRADGPGVLVCAVLPVADR